MPDSPSWLGRGGRGRWQPGWRGGFRGRVVPVAPPCLPELFFLFFFYEKKKKFFLPPETSWEDPAGPMGAAPQRAANGAGGAGEASGAPTEGQAVGLLG